MLLVSEGTKSEDYFQLPDYKGGRKGKSKEPLTGYRDTKDTLRGGSSKGRMVHGKDEVTRHSRDRSSIEENAVG